MKDPELYVRFENETEVALSEKISGLTFLSKSSTPNLTNNYTDNNGINGSVFTFATHQKNQVQLNLLLDFATFDDLNQSRRELYSYFVRQGIFRIRTSYDSSIVEFVRMTGFDVKPAADGSNYADVVINADNPSGFKFSRDDSIHQDDLWDDYQLNSNEPILTKDDFEFNQREFVIYNPSDKKIDPYLQRDKLQISCSYNGRNISITNETNGTNWSFEQSLNKQDTVTLDGIITYLNGNQSSINSNFGNLVLEKGANKIRVDGADDFNVKFIFPFIYI